MTTTQNAGIRELVREMAAKVVEVAPSGWRQAAVTTAVYGAGGSGSRGLSYKMTDGEERPSRVDLFDESRGLARLVRGWTGRLTIGLVVDLSGRYEAIISSALTEKPDSAGYLYVLRPDALPADPGNGQQGPAAPTRVGDPAEAVRLFREYLRLRAEILGEEEQLPPPLDVADREELAETLEDKLGVTLPEDLCALYGVADGADEVDLFGGYLWLGLNDLVDVAVDRVWMEGKPTRVERVTSVLFDTDPPETVRRSTDRPGWIPFADDTGGEYLAVDLDPARNGHLGQVIRVGTEDPPSYVADSVTTVLRWHVEALIRGDYTCDDGDLDINLEDKPVRWELDRACWWRVEGADAARRGIPPETQRLTVTGASEADLAPVREAPRLSQVELARGVTTDLGPLRGVPVELLELDLERIDLAPLAGHPTLRVVKLRTARPVELGPLRTIPHLYGLDLSGASVRDIGTIAELDGLRYLSMRHDQWLELWKRTDNLPPLAVVGLDGEPPLSVVVEWAARCASGLGTTDLQHHTGQLS